MAYKIIAQRNSFLERSITFEADGKLETISAPSANATFEDLIARIEEQFGSGKTKEIMLVFPGKALYNQIVKDLESSEELPWPRQGAAWAIGKTGVCSVR